MSYDMVTGRLVSRTAVHVGSGEGAGTTDALLRRDAQGRLLIPGTALAGALRTIATRLAHALAIDRAGRCGLRITPIVPKTSRAAVASAICSGM